MDIVAITKVFDPADGFGPFTGQHEVTDATVAWRDGRWWMCAAGQPSDRHSLELFTATLPPGAPLTAAGWTLTADPEDPALVQLLAGHERSHAWDLRGGRHCPSYARGWDPERREMVERVYYAGAAEQPWGPYAIGFLEWNGDTWLDREAPAFSATEAWERGSVYEPNVVFHDGRWKMWYVAGSNADRYLVHGYTESADGATDWSPPRIFAPAGAHVFDVRVFENGGRWEAVFSRVWLGEGPPPPDTGLWWCHAPTPSPDLADWSTPIQILPAAPNGWYGGPWKPSPVYGENGHLFVFFDGAYGIANASGFPLAFTLGCVELVPA